MIINQREGLIEQEQAAELYSFTLGTLTYYFTSYPSSVTYSGNTYTPIAIRRSGISLNNIFSKVEMTIKVPINATSFFRSFLISTQIHPLSIDLLRVFLEDLTVSKTLFQGNAYGMEIQEGECTIHFQLFTDELQRNVCNVFTRSTCNNTFLDSVCGLAAASYEIDRVILGILNVPGTIDSVSIGTGEYVIQVQKPSPSKPDGYFVGGKCAKNLENDFRMITRYFTSSVGSLVWVNYPIDGLQVGDTLALFPGCSKFPGNVDEYGVSPWAGVAPIFSGDYCPNTCKNTFSNLAHFVGMPYVPNKDISQSPITQT